MIAREAQAVCSSPPAAGMLTARVVAGCAAVGYSRRVGVFPAGPAAASGRRHRGRAAARTWLAPLLLSLPGMHAGGRHVLGHYEILGIPPGATAREVELAFARWRSRCDAGGADAEAFGRAEAAYHVLADSVARERHDRQIGLLPHPAWGEGRSRMARGWTVRAIGLLEAGRAAQARKLLERAVALGPTDARARSYLAVALARTGGSLHAAARHAERAVSLSPGEPTFLFNLAEVYAAAGLTGRMLSARARAWRATALTLLRPPAARV